MVWLFKTSSSSNLRASNSLFWLPRTLTCCPICHIQVIVLLKYHIFKRKGMGFNSEVVESKWIEKRYMMQIVRTQKVDRYQKRGCRARRISKNKEAMEIRLVYCGRQTGYKFQHEWDLDCQEDCKGPMAHLHKASGPQHCSQSWMEFTEEMEKVWRRLPPVTNRSHFELLPSWGERVFYFKHIWIRHPNKSYAGN